MEGTKAFQGGEIMVTKALQHAAEDEKGKRRMRNMVMTMTPIPLGDDDDHDGDGDDGNDHYLIPVVCCTHEPK